MLLVASQETEIVLNNNRLEAQAVICGARAVAEVMPDWTDVLEKPAVAAQLQKLARGMFPDDEETAQQAYSYAKEKMLEDDARRLRKYKGKSKPETYLRIVCSHLLTDYHRKIHGRFRAPEVVNHLKKLGKEIGRLGCKKLSPEDKKLSPEDIVDKLEENGVTPAPKKENVAAIMRAVRAVAGCGPATFLDNVDIKAVWTYLCKDRRHPEEIIKIMCLTGDPSEADVRAAIRAVRIVDTNCEAITFRADVDPEEHLRGSFREEPDLQAADEQRRILLQDVAPVITAEERIILKMYYEMGYKPAEIAEAMGMSRSIIYKITRKASKVKMKLRKELERSGFSAQKIRDHFSDEP